MAPDVGEAESLVTADMDVELQVFPSSPLSVSHSDAGCGVSLQRNREENDGDLTESNNLSKKQKVDKSVEEDRLEKTDSVNSAEKSEEFETEVVRKADYLAAVQQTLKVDKINKLETEVVIGDKIVNETEKIWKNGVDGSQEVGDKIVGETEVFESSVEIKIEDSENKDVEKTEEFEQEMDVSGKSIVEETKKVEKFTAPVSLGPKTFNSSVQMFDYFSKLLSHWSPNLDLNKYEHMVLMELVKKGSSDPAQKMGEGGVKAFQIRTHPQWKSKCYYLVRADGSVVDFSFRKCVNNILPLPDNMQVNNDINKMLSGRRGGGRGRGRGRGSGGRHHDVK